MIPFDKVREIISKHKLLEEELSSDKIDKKNLQIKKYSDLNEIQMMLNNIFFDETKRDLKKLDRGLIGDENLAKVELMNFKKCKNKWKRLKIILLPKDELTKKMQL